jgi:ketosteroid isomerase-like protein
MSDHPDIDVFKRAYAAFAAGDMATLADVFAEDVG